MAVLVFALWLSSFSFSLMAVLVFDGCPRFVLALRFGPRFAGPRFGPRFGRRFTRFGRFDVGDYDGDGFDDAAVYRDGATPGAPSFFVIRLSSTGAQRTIAAGEDGSFPSAGIDQNGDNRADITVQSNAGGGNGRFRSYGGSSGFSFLATNLGLITDSIVLGNHAGTLRGDITLVRSVGGVFSWVTRETFTGTVQQTIEFGQSGDFVVTGDYDGDGLDDHALWRPSSAVGLSKFIVRRSTSVAVPIEVPSGLQGDYPVARSRIH